MTNTSLLNKKPTDTSVPPSSNFQYWKNPTDAAGKPPSNFTPQMSGYQMQPGAMPDTDRTLQQSRSIASLMGQDQLGLSQSAATSGAGLAAGNQTANLLQQQKNAIGLGQAGTASGGNLIGMGQGQSINAFGQPVSKTTTEKYANVDIMGRSYAEIAREREARERDNLDFQQERSMSQLGAYNTANQANNDAANQRALQTAQLASQQALANTEAQKAKDVAALQSQAQMASSLFSSLNVGSGGSNFRYW